MIGFARPNGRYRPPWGAQAEGIWLLSLIAELGRVGAAVRQSSLRTTLLATSSALAMIVAMEGSAQAQCANNNVPGGVNNASAINCISYNNGVNNTGDIVNQSGGTITPTHAYPP